ncbi:MAG: hypothetical protein QM723_22475 [Myxococcaceae bacterium]
MLALALCACPGDKKPDGGSGGGAVGGGSATGGGGGGGGGVGGGGHDAGMHDAGVIDAGFKGVTVDEWCADLASASCSRDLRCQSVDDTHWAECLQRYLSVCDQTSFSRGVHEGRIQFLSSQADDCLNGYAHGSCSAAPDVCATVFTGMVEPDGGCLIAEDCDSNTGFCYLYDGTCPHRCRGFVPKGSSCDGFSIQCTADAWCGAVDGGFYYTCLDPVNDGLPCVSYNQCQKGSICSSGTCVKQNAKTGEVCGSNSIYPYCDDDDFCRQDVDTMPPPPGVCTRKGGIGALCNGYYACLPTLRCSSTYQTGTCQPKGGVGDKCSNYTDCEDGMFCQPSTSTCEILPKDGGDCTDKGSFYACHVGYFCDFNAPGQQYDCVALKALGDRCNYDGECLSNDCEYGTLPDGGFGGTCIPGCSQRADGGF